MSELLDEVYEHADARTRAFLRKIAPWAGWPPDPPPVRIKVDAGDDAPPPHHRPAPSGNA